MDESFLRSRRLRDSPADDDPDEPLEIVFGDDKQSRANPPLRVSFTQMLIQRIRFPLLALGFLSLLAAMWAGLIRMGWAFPRLSDSLPIAHGPLMVCGFLGTLIGLERGIALQKRWTYLAPLFTALGAVMLVVGAPDVIGRGLMLLGSLVLIIIYVTIVRIHLALYTIILLLGAVAWFIGNLFWLVGWGISSVVLWWASFLILTIAGERLELARFVRLTANARALFVVALSVLFAGVIVSPFEDNLGARVTGFGMLALALWLLRFDLARRNIRQKGLTRFIAVALLSGYVWLGVSGGLALVNGAVYSGFKYDAFLHTLFLGFVSAMILGHAPIILPSVTGRALRYSASFYAPLVLLHASLVLRVVGDLIAVNDIRLWGGMLNVIALLFFLGNTIRSTKK